jgi:hypothetical protein
MVDFDHTIVELVGNEVVVGCRGGDGRSQHNRDQRCRENDLDGKFHENPRVPGRPSPENHGQQSRKFRPGISPSCQKNVKELSLSCQKLGKLLRTLVPLAVREFQLMLKAD